MVLIEAGIVATDTPHMATKIKVHSNLFSSTASLLSDVVLQSQMGTRRYGSENVAFEGHPDVYDKTLKTAHELFQRSIPFESISAKTFCDVVNQVVDQGFHLHLLIDYHYVYYPRFDRPQCSDASPDSWPSGAHRQASVGRPGAREGFWDGVRCDRVLSQL